MQMKTTVAIYWFFQNKQQVDFTQCKVLKGCRMGRSDKVSLWYVSLLINTRFRFSILE